MFLRTLLQHGMPHFENMGPRTPLLSGTVERSWRQRDQLSWQHVELMRRLWKGRLLLKGILHKEDARVALETAGRFVDATGSVTTGTIASEIDGNSPEVIAALSNCARQFQVIESPSP